MEQEKSGIEALGRFINSLTASRRSPMADGHIDVLTVMLSVGFIFDGNFG